MLSATPLLRIQRDLYDIPRGWDRFKRYLAMMTGGTDDLVLPLQAMNPMGKAHVADALDRLLALEAEGIVAEAVAEAERRLGFVAEKIPLRLGFVCVCGGGSSHR